jgi:hypothetical protein
VNTTPEGLDRLRQDLLLDAVNAVLAAPCAEFERLLSVRETPNPFAGCEQAKVARELLPEPTAEPGSINTGPADFDSCGNRL